LTFYSLLENAVGQLSGTPRPGPENEAAIWAKIYLDVTKRQRLGELEAAREQAAELVKDDLQRAEEKAWTRHPVQSFIRGLLGFLLQAIIVCGLIFYFFHDRGGGDWSQS
jgi:hypothetical protein